ncbi:hypothetical protein ACFLW8_03840 [Chloroflexota bacterium]
MKKKVVLALLAVALLLSGVIGGVYAANHQPVDGEKLIGTGQLGVKSQMEFWSTFHFTNPNCEDEISVMQVSIIKHDPGLGPLVVYEGPYINVKKTGGPPVRTVVTRPMMPHEKWWISLDQYMYLGGDLTASNSWLSEQAAHAQPLAHYTVEIGWEGKGRAHSPIGWQLYRRNNWVGEQLSENRVLMEMVNISK